MINTNKTAAEQIFERWFGKKTPVDPTNDIDGILPKDTTAGPTVVNIDPGHFQYIPDPNQFQIQPWDQITPFQVPQPNTTPYILPSVNMSKTTIHEDTLEQDKVKSKAVKTAQQILDESMNLPGNINDRILAAMQQYKDQYNSQKVDADWTHISICLDKSGSMDNIVNDIIGGFNSFIKAQQEQPGKCTVSLMTFSNPSHQEMVRNFVNLNEVDQLTSQTYRPGGGTALNDSFAKLMVDTKKTMDTFNEIPGKVLFVSLTDGEENASINYTKTSRLKELICNFESELGWKFIYIGANQDAFQEGQTARGFTRSMAFESTTDGVMDMYANLSTATAMYRSSGNL